MGGLPSSFARLQGNRFPLQTAKGLRRQSNVSSGHSAADRSTAALAAATAEAARVWWVPCWCGSTSRFRCLHCSCRQPPMDELLQVSRITAVARLERDNTVTAHVPVLTTSGAVALKAAWRPAVVELVPKLTTPSTLVDHVCGWCRRRRYLAVPSIGAALEKPPLPHDGC